MIETKTEVNYQINWNPIVAITDETGEAINNTAKEITEKVLEDRKHYFDLLRRFLIEINNLGRDEIDDIFKRYNVHFVDIDDIKRVNLDEPVQA
jgi:hypothetical protein